MTHKIFRMVSSLFLALAMIVVSSSPQTTRAAGPWYVATTGDDANDCISPTTPCATINGAIGKAAEGEEIRVAVGSYVETGPEVGVVIDKSTILTGGWDSAFTSQSGYSTIDGENARIAILAFGQIVSLDHFVVQHGFSTVRGDGGGIVWGGNNNTWHLTITNSFIQDNVSTSLGGGIYNPGAQLTLVNTTVRNNVAGFGGGGIYTGAFSDAILNLTNSTITNNNAPRGGGIYNDRGVVNMNNTTVSNNTATIGGGILTAGTLTLINGTVSNNSARISTSGLGNAGGGIYSTGMLTLNNTTISGNGTNDTAGGVYNTGTLVINNSTVSGNNSDSYGGGAYNTGTLTLNNSTISGNNAPNGGGLQNDGVATIRNTILAKNMAGSGSDCRGNAISSSDYNLIGDTANCDFTLGTGDITNIDPLLGPLQDNGGPTFTHALLPGSPAIDASNPAGCRDQNGNLLTTDQRGVARPQGTRCDIGSLELEADGGGGIEVSIDIKPGRFPNRIKLTRNVCRANDNLYVAILTTPTFNARTVDVSSIQLGDPNLSGKAIPLKGRITNVDGDGDKDMVLTFTLCGIATNGALNLTSTEMVLTGRTLDGVSITGRDSVKVVR